MEKFVVVKSLTTETKGTNSWLKCTDHENVSWNIFAKDTKLELNKSYLFTFFKNDKGYDQVSKITPLVNIFHQKALQETTSRSEVLRNFSVAFSYSKDLVIAKEVPIGEIFEWADKIYTKFNEKADEVIKNMGEPK